MLIRLGGGRTPFGTEKHKPCAWSGSVIRILAEDHDLDLVEWGQVERPEPVGPRREDALPRFALGQQEAL